VSLKHALVSLVRNLTATHIPRYSLQIASHRHSASILVSDKDQFLLLLCSVGLWTGYFKSLCYKQAGRYPVNCSRTLILQMIYFAKCGTSESCGYLDEYGECLLRPWSAYFVDKDQYSKHRCMPTSSYHYGGCATGGKCGELHVQIEHVTNIAVVRRTNLPHIGALIAAHPPIPADVQSSIALRICRDTSMSCPCMDAPRVRLRSSWIAQLKSDTCDPVASSWMRTSDRDVWRTGATPVLLSSLR